MKSKYASAQFWIDTADRAASTFAQAALGAGIGTATSLVGLDLVQVAAVAGLAAAASVLQSVAFRGRGDQQS